MELPVNISIEFRVTEAKYTPELEDRSSEAFKQMSGIMISQMSDMFRNSSMGPMYKGTEVMKFR